MSEPSRSGTAPPREAELAEAEERARGAGKAAEAMSRSASDVGRLAGEVRRQRRENESLRAENAELADRLRKAERTPSGGTPSEGRKPAPPHGDEPVEAELGSLMSAPFQVSPQAASAAKSDPLAALAVQVARALSDDARDLERARLIAMAFAASRGDLEAFWSARRQRGGKKAAVKESTK